MWKEFTRYEKNFLHYIRVDSQWSSQQPKVQRNHQHRLRNPRHQMSGRHRGNINWHQEEGDPNIEDDKYTKVKIQVVVRYVPEPAQIVQESDWDRTRSGWQ